MCLILIAYRLTPGQPLVVAANRDEFHARPSAPAHWWDDAPGLLAGRDLQAGGTWLGVRANGRFAAVTNFTDPDLPPPPRSRGALVADFLRGAQTSTDYAASIQGERYQGFNLLLWDGRTLACASNRGATKTLEPGCHALTNAELGARWPKAVDGVIRLRDAVAAGADLDGLIDLMRHDQLPEGDAGPPRSETAESRATPCFIQGDAYGTRASTAVIQAEDGSVALAEQSYGPQGALGERRDFRIASDVRNQKPIGTRPTQR
ncbi:MAG: NRDE family protein [Gammaproteobacteria bacterium]|nr:NRDE family protein [Gammaproteobacteria bacterium]